MGNYRYFCELDAPNRSEFIEKISWMSFSLTNYLLLMEDFHNYQDQVVVTFHDEIGDYLDTNYSDIVSEAATMM